MSAAWRRTPRTRGQGKKSPPSANSEERAALASDRISWRVPREEAFDMLQAMNNGSRRLDGDDPRQHAAATLDLAGLDR